MRRPNCVSAHANLKVTEATHTHKHLTTFKLGNNCVFILHRFAFRGCLWRTRLHLSVYVGCRVQFSADIPRARVCAPANSAFTLEDAHSAVLSVPHKRPSIFISPAAATATARRHASERISAVAVVAVNHTTPLPPSHRCRATVEHSHRLILLRTRASVQKPDLHITQLYAVLALPIGVGDGDVARRLEPERWRRRGHTALLCASKRHTPIHTHTHLDFRANAKRFVMFILYMTRTKSVTSQICAAGTHARAGLARGGGPSSVA